MYVIFTGSNNGSLESDTQMSLWPKRGLKLNQFNVDVAPGGFCVFVQYVHFAL